MESRDQFIQLDEVLLFFPALLKNFIDLIFKSLDDNTPRTYIAILLVLQKDGRQPISTIAERLSVAKPNMTPIVKDLIKKGWIKKGVHQWDRRIVNVELTETGEEYLNKTVDKLNLIIRQKLSILSEEESQELFRSINSLIILGTKIIGE
ncbi:MAG: MarR family transcriptional regulator [Clostridiales bacterium]|jgi:DNA-binding MarR family transcriptional regulator|nr:MarR family transcriptional regulator [Eubacteriales bacterium]MDH7565746.1 MarR family transcriptional regulator [Clostridiales bacterium]